MYIFLHFLEFIITMCFFLILMSTSNAIETHWGPKRTSYERIYMCYGNATRIPSHNYLTLGKLDIFCLAETYLGFSLIQDESSNCRKHRKFRKFLGVESAEITVSQVKLLSQVICLSDLTIKLIANNEGFLFLHEFSLLKINLKFSVRIIWKN